MPHNGVVVTPSGQTLAMCHVLGSGTFGVATAVKTRKGDTLCLKEVTVRPRDQEAKDEALKEVEILKSCKHPNVVAFYDAWFDRGGRLYILMEYAANGSLDALVRQYAKTGKRFTAHKVAHFLQELTSALHYCHHELHIMHRDIKPANVLVDSLGTLKLADFGHGKQLGGPAQACETFCGTPLYVSPEQCNGVTYSYPSDVWALGCVVFELMALRPLWMPPGVPEPSQPALFRRIATGAVDLSALKDYPSRLVDTTKWMLQRVASKRATTAQLLDILEMRAPPTALAPPLPEDLPTPPARLLDHEESLERRRRLVDEARAMAAASVIQSSFRATLQRRRPQPVQNQPAVEAIQRAVRASLNRRRRNLPPRTHNEPHPPLPSAVKPLPPLFRPAQPASVRKGGGCSTRLHQLAQPRLPARNKMYHQVPRAAWL